MPFESHTHSHSEVSSLWPAGQVNELSHTQTHVLSSKVYIGGQASTTSHSQLHVELLYTCKEEDGVYRMIE